MPNNSSDAPPRKRAVRYNTPGDSHYLTFSCYRRQPFLSRERTCQWLLTPSASPARGIPSG